MNPSNIRIEPVKVTWGSDDLGYCEGDISVSLSEDTVDIKSHQTGSTLLSKLRTGKMAEVKLTLKETDAASMKRILGQAGTSVTPAGGDEVTAWGSSTDFANIIDDAKKLVLHPIALGALDLERDLCFWKAYLQPQSIQYSGEKEMTVEVTFTIFTDTAKPKTVDFMVYGDHTQTFV